MRTSTRIALAALLCAALPAQNVTITSTNCTDNQMVGFWGTNTGSTLPGQWQSLEITTQALTLDFVGTFGFLVLTAGNQGCGVPLPLGPSCYPAVTPNEIAGPMIFDPSSVIAIELCAHQWYTFWSHHLHVPGAALPPATAPWQWTAQVVIYDQPTGCWLATGNALRFTASL